jgi:hypothetical protein
MTQPPFDPEKARHMAALLVYAEVHPDAIVAHLTRRYTMDRNAAIDLVHELLLIKVDAMNLDGVDRSVADRAALAAEHDLDETMHGDDQ